MKPCYINGLSCISAQKTIDNATFLEEVLIQDSNVLPVIKPSYKEYINRTAIRRMGKGVKMGVVAAKIAMEDAGIEQPNAILTGSGFGCLNDTEKFLGTLLDNNEQYLTPTAFIQSTHNTVGAQIALGLKCQAYNLTYVQGSLSFESALLDGLLLLAEEPDNSMLKNILVGGVEELGNHTTSLFQLIHHIKKDSPNTLALLASQSKGAIASEGAQFFVISNQPQENTYAQIQDLELIPQLDVEKLVNRINLFLARNQLTATDIDIVVLGNNGDIEFDYFYQQLQNGLFKSTEQLYYKHLSGEYFTASAFGLWLAAKVLKLQQIPAILRLNKVIHKEAKGQFYKRILLYNQYRGEDHGFVLLNALRL